MLGCVSLASCKADQVQPEGLDKYGEDRQLLTCRVGATIAKEISMACIVSSMCFTLMFVYKITIGGEEVGSEEYAVSITLLSSLLLSAAYRRQSYNLKDPLSLPFQPSHVFEPSSDTDG